MCPFFAPNHAEAERALSRLEEWQRVIGGALFASMLVNVGTVLSVSAAGAAATGATLSWVGAAAATLLSLKSYVKIAQMEKKEKALLGLA